MTRYKKFNKTNKENLEILRLKYRLIKNGRLQI